MRFQILALSLLLSIPASARLQLHTHAEILNAKYGTHTVDTTIQLDPHESCEIYQQDDVKITVELLGEKDTSCGVSIRFYGKNTEGLYEQLEEFVLVPNYLEPATIALGEKQGDLFIEKRAATIRACKGPCCMNQ